MQGPYQLETRPERAKTVFRTSDKTQAAVLAGQKKGTFYFSARPLSGKAVRELEHALPAEK